MTEQGFTIDPTRDLVLERVVDVPRSLVWKAWTNAEHVKQWFAPEPWKTVECEIDLRPGGRFYTVMQSPDGQRFPNTGCYLDVKENERLVFTSALEPGYRPADATGQPFVFTAVITMEDVDGGTRYTAMALHPSDAGRRQHEEMGFHFGWGKALDQLVAVAKTM